MIRSFIAMDLSPEIYRNLYTLIQDFKKKVPYGVRWIAAESIHVTLKFLGDVAEENIRLIANSVETVCRKYAPLQISIGGFGVFPRAEAPRVVWIGCQIPEELISFQRELEMAMEVLGHEKEHRAYKPHLTIGRVSQNINKTELSRLVDALKTMEVGILGDVKVSQVHLYRSDLLPSGAKYTLLNSFTLGMREGI